MQYIAFFDEGRAGGPVNAKLNIDDAFDLTLQAGVDVEIGDGWHLNADVKKTWIETDAKWQNTGITADVEIDPWIISAGISYRFNLFGARHAPQVSK